ncbi:MAG TPA: hypothetical protein VMV62_00030 [Candidatus Paceibacterota bacterium]|nr:hypothetical protein [Candidatus Paceibacterota bacterium]
MDEIIIEEKKYVSSKQAAKITGYAKDYIGQLCREGRVPARLVGRSWYALESAIQDHRFGNQEAVEPKETTNAIQSESFSVSDTWEFPRYEASHNEVLPTVNRLHTAEKISLSDDEGLEDVVEIPSNLHESWKEWFDHVADTLSAVEEPVRDAIEAVTASETHEEEHAQSFEEEVVSVPLHIMRQQRAIEMEAVSRYDREQEALEYRDTEKGDSSAVLSIQIIGAVLAIVSVALAVIGSGFIDEYMTSGSQAQFISGISVYDK